MTETPPLFTVVGGRPPLEPPSFAAETIRMIGRLGEVGLTPSMVLLPAPTGSGEPMFTTFMGIPVGWAPGAEVVQLVVDVPSALTEEEPTARLDASPER